MRIPSGKVDQLIFFVALDSTDRVTRKTGLSSFTVYRSRNGATATVYTTPTVAELSSSNMPGVYALTVDEDTTIASTSDSEEYCVHITATGMAPVTRTVELYRRDTTSGNTALVDSSGRVDVAKIAGTSQTARDIGASVLLSTGTGTGQLDFTSGVVKANVTQNGGSAITSASGVQEVKVASIAANAITATAIAADAITDAKVASDVTIASVTGAVGSVTGLTASDVGAIKVKTDNLPASPAAVGDIPTANQNADALLDRSAGIETGKTPRQGLRLMLAALVGKASGLSGTTATYRDTGDSKDRIVATVDADGNRSAITLDAS